MPEVRVVFFASLRDATEVNEICLSAATLGDLDARLQEYLSSQAYAALNTDNIRIALNQTLLDGFNPDQELAAGDEIAYLPPVTGG